MKQLAIIMVMLLSVATANAQLIFKQIETNDSTTKFVFTDTKMRREAKTVSALLYNDGQNFAPLSVISKYENCTNTYTVIFPRQTILNETTVTLTIDDKRHTETIWNQIIEAAIRHYPYINGSKVLIINKDQ